MEYLEGETLAQRLQQGARCRSTQVLEVGAQVADALAGRTGRASSTAISSRAISCSRSAGAKLLDFGLAKLPVAAREARRSRCQLSPTAGAGDDARARCLARCRTWRPSSWRGRRPTRAPTSSRSGACSTRWLTGRRAFAGESQASVISAIMSSEPPPLSTLQPLTPPALDRLVRRCLAKDPDDCWQHAADVAEELRGISQDAVAPASGRTPLRARRAWIFQAVALSVLVSAIAIGTTVYFSRGWGDEAVDSIAVLPFVNVSGDPETEYLSEGIPENLNGTLTQLPNLRVLPPSMVVRFKGKAIDVEKAGRELKVRAIVTGKIVLRGDSLSVSIELTDLRTSRCSWAGLIAEDSPPSWPCRRRSPPVSHSGCGPG